jgi:hypothetical protein
MRLPLRARSLPDWAASARGDRGHATLSVPRAVFAAARLVLATRTLASLSMPNRRF